MKSLLITSLLTIASTTYAQQQAVLPGDHADPSVTKIGDMYWASATSSNWAPEYPLLKSKDLVHWQTAGYIFNKLPDWADYYFWAPEISYEKGKVYAYYTAHKKGGNLCVAVASADKPEGPWKDHGPLVCQSDGSIDAFPMRDENGKLFLIWKEDGNSIRQPTPIFAQEMNEERTALLGEKKEIFRNDQPWESNLVEGVSMIRRGGYFYAVYAAAGCCGDGCTYVTGVARAKNLLGPWEKFSGNPILTSDENWKCPGHGTMIEKDGKHYFLYHAYSTKSTVYSGRQGVLREFDFTPDGWLAFKAPMATPNQVPALVKDDFSRFSNQWNWSVFHRPEYQVKGGKLQLKAIPEQAGVYLARKTYTGNYTAQVQVEVPATTELKSGLSLIGDDDNALGISVQKGELLVWKREKGKDKVLQTLPLAGSKMVTLQAQVKNGNDVTFKYLINGKNTQVFDSVNGAFLPPWDRAVRVGVIAKGEGTGVFDNFQLVTEKE